MNATRLGLRCSRKFNFQNAIVQARRDTIVVNLLTENERPQEISQMVLAVNQYGIIGGTCEGPTKQSQLVVLNL